MGVIPQPVTNSPQNNDGRLAVPCYLIAWLIKPVSGMSSNQWAEGGVVCVCRTVRDGGPDTAAFHERSRTPDNKRT